MRTLAFALLLLAAGCGTTQTYEGPKKSAQEVAIVETNVGELTLDTTWVTAVDGKDLHLAYPKIEVLPGLRSLRVNIKRGFLTRGKTMSFEAIAGRTYRLIGEFRSGSAWIEDKSSGQVVAGEKP